MHDCHCSASNLIVIVKCDIFQLICIQFSSTACAKRSAAVYAMSCRVKRARHNTEEL